MYGIISADDWTAIQETLYILSIPGMLESIQAARSAPVGTGAADLDW